MKGFLEKIDNVWHVKWSDLHSFSHGTHWSYTKLSPNSVILKYIIDGGLKYKPLEEGVEVEFKMIIAGYNETTFEPYQTAQLVFPEVEVFEKEQYIKEYVKNGGILFSIDMVDVIRDGGTIVLNSRGSSGGTTYYIHKDNHTLHYRYPTTDENMVTDVPTQYYILDRLKRYEEDCEHNLKRAKDIISKVKFPSNE